MPFRTAGSRGAFSPSDVEMLQSAYNGARELLGHSSATDKELDQLARLIIRLFENGERDLQIIAKRCVEISKLMPRR
ncbi:hypothetical protein D3C80_683180 [compost metagenome]